MTTLEKIGLAIVAIFALFLGGKCYGDARAKSAVQLHVATSDDSVSQVDRARAIIAENAARVATARVQQAAEQATRTAAHADSLLQVAEARGDGAEREAATVDTISMAPSVRRVFLNLQLTYIGLKAAADSEHAANVQLRATVAQEQAANAALWSVISADSLTITDQRRAIEAFKVVKTPSNHTVIRVAEGVALAGVGFLAGRGSK